MGMGSRSDDRWGSERLREVWDKQAASYDKQMGFVERRLLGAGNRAWACGRTRGEVLEVAIGTGLNLPFYPAEVAVTGLDLSPQMLEQARVRATALGREVDLHEGDAQDLPFDAASFDSVVCTYSLCNIPDVRRALSEMKRVLRAGGRLLLVDHIRSSVTSVFWVQRLIELATARFAGEHMTRRPLEHVRAEGFEVDERDRFRLGIVERLAAHKRPEAR